MMAICSFVRCDLEFLPLNQVGISQPEFGIRHYSSFPEKKLISQMLD
jgi:hypothetical protein